MDLRFRNRPAWLLTLLLWSGCSDAVQMTHETEQGGVVTFLFKEDRGGPMGSPHRKDALKLIDRKCPGRIRGGAGWRDERLQQHVER